MNKTTAQKALDCIEEFKRDDVWRTYYESVIAELEAVIAQPVEPVACQFQLADGNWYNFVNEQHKTDTVTSCTFPIRYLFAAPKEPAAPGWLPISQAPKNVNIDIWGKHGRTADCWFGQSTYGGDYGFVYESDYDCNGPVISLVADPTHYMMPPGAPT